jgi:hypothetical protein
MGYKPIKDYDFISSPRDIRVEKLTEEDIAQYHQEKWNEDKGMFAVVINNQTLCFHQSFMDQSRLIPSLFRFTRKQAFAVMDMFLRLNYPYPYRICKFSYNGFGGTSDKGVTMPYTGHFKNWTGDPGVARMDCSDGKERIIPTFAIKYGHITLPNDMTRAEGSGRTQFFGSVSTSE